MGDRPWDQKSSFTIACQFDTVGVDLVDRHGDVTDLVVDINRDRDLGHSITCLYNFLNQQSTRVTVPAVKTSSSLRGWNLIGQTVSGLGSRPEIDRTFINMWVQRMYR